MPYAEIYSHNQQQQSAASGQDQTLGVSQSPQLEQGITLKGAIGFFAVAQQVQPVATSCNKLYWC